MIKSVSLMDFRLGIRMLAKYPWLTLVGGLGMAVAVAIGASFFGLIYSMMDPRLPLDEGDRVVSVQTWEGGMDGRPERHIIHDFTAWRAQARTIVDMAAFRRVSRTLVTTHEEPAPIQVAEITASGFRVARVQPLLGRTLRDQDEAPGAPLVVVLGYDIWKSGFGGDSTIVGRSIHVGKNAHTVIGVMPAGFAFPLHEDVWVPFRWQAADFEPRKGPLFFAFGRLAPRVSIEDAQAEMTAIGKGVSAAHPETHAKLRPTVLPYTYPFFDIDNIQTVWAFHALQVAVTLLLVLVCANVATLIYARTAARQPEIVVRSALGASRWRIVGQLFAEALVLASLASLIGIVAARFALRQIAIVMESAVGEMPFWMNINVSTGVILYVVGVTLLAAMIIGALPALQATGRRVQPHLRRLGGGSGMHLGRTWTILIVAQVAFAVAILPATIFYSVQFGRYGLMNPGFPAGEYLLAVLGKEQTTPRSAEADAYQRAFGLEFNAQQALLVQRLRSHPGVAAVTYSESNPGEEPTAMIEIEGRPLPDEEVNYSLAEGSRRGFGVRPNRVEPGFFHAFDMKVIAGRAFNAADVDSAASAAIVNESFVRTYFRGENAVGRRFRYVGRGGDTDGPEVPLNRWFEIVGVVSEMPPRELDPGSRTTRVYHPPIPGHLYQAMFVRARGMTPDAFAPTLKRMTIAVDPSLQLRGVSSLETSLRSEQRPMRLASIALITLTLSVLLLSAAGIYSLMSLSVNQRRREIGIRSAIGAQPRRILTAIFARSARQLAIGVVIGILAALVLDRLMWGELMVGQAEILLPIVSALMIIVGLLAASGPARRGLRIQPNDALREL